MCHTFQHCKCKTRDSTCMCKRIPRCHLKQRRSLCVRALAKFQNPSVDIPKRHVQWQMAMPNLKVTMVKGRCNAPMTNRDGETSQLKSAHVPANNLQ